MASKRNLQGAILTKPGQIRKIILFCLSPMGDTLFATPALRALREAFPEARIDVLTSPMAALVLANNPFQLELMVASDKLELFRLLRQVRKNNYDLALGLSQSGSLFTRFCGAPRWGDFFGIGSYDQRSVVRMCLEVLHHVGIQSNNLRTEFWLKERDQWVAERFLQSSGYDEAAPLIALHCGGHYFTRKRWPLEHFVALTGYLQDNGWQVLLVGGAEDLPAVDVIRDFYPGITSAVGCLKLGETAALIKRCDLLVGNDSGPLHLAAALQVPTLGLFGPTDPQQFYPYHHPAHSFLYKKLSCSPCYRFGGGLWQYLPRCSRPYCMEAIAPLEVLALVEETKLTHCSLAMR